MLKRTYNGLQGVTSDASNGTTSELGFSAIFKDDTNIPYIKAVYQRIADGSKMPVNTNKVQEDHHPTIVCAVPGDGDTAMSKFTEPCVGQKGPGVHIQGTHFIVLCPSFFDLKKVPEASDCPRMTDGGFFSYPYQWITSQYSVILHQLSHFYLGGEVLQPEISDLKKIFLLPAASSKLNARSYEFYAASKP